MKIHIGGMAMTRKLTDVEIDAIGADFSKRQEFQREFSLKALKVKHGRDTKTLYSAWAEFLRRQKKMV